MICCTAKEEMENLAQKAADNKWLCISLRILSGSLR